MATTFELNDDCVVVIVGSGAGGGTLGNELAQKGIKVVLLEAGKQREHRHVPERRVGQLPADLLARQAHHLGQLAGGARLPEPAGLDLQDRRRHHHPLGRRLAAVPGARVQGQDGLWRRPGRQSAGLAGHAGRARALLRQGRGQDGCDPDQRDPRPARQQQLQGVLHRRQAARATRRSIPAIWRSTASRAPTGHPASRSASASRAASPRPSGRTLYTEIPAALDTGNLDLRPRMHGAAGPARRCGQGHGRALCRQGRQSAGPEGAAWSASPATRSRARACF